MSYFNQLISMNDDIREAAIANRRETTFIERKIIKHLGKGLMKMVEEVRELNAAIEVVLKDGFENVPYGGETSWVYDTPKMDPSSRTFERALNDLSQWMLGVEPSGEFIITPEVWEEIGEEVQESIDGWRVMSFCDRSKFTYTSIVPTVTEAVRFMRLKRRDEPAMQGIDEHGNPVTDFLTLNDVEDYNVVCDRLSRGWREKVKQPKFRILLKSLHPRDRLSEVCRWKVESNMERDGYTSGEVWEFEHLEEAVVWIKDHPDGDHIFYGMDDAGRRATTWLDLDDVEEVTE